VTATVGGGGRHAMNRPDRVVEPLFIADTPPLGSRGPPVVDPSGDGADRRHQEYAKSRPFG